MGFKTENKIKLEGGMSSMTDLVFLLLIFFIVISTLISSGVNIDLPKNSTSQTKDQPLEVNINKENVYEIKSNDDHIYKTTSLNELEHKIKSKINKNKPVIVLKGDKESDWEYTVHVIDIAKRNRIKIAIKD